MDFTFYGTLKIFFRFKVSLKGFMGPPWSPLVPLGQPEYFTSVTNFGVAGSTWRGVVLSQSIRGGRTYLHAVECAGDLHVARIYM